MTYSYSQERHLLSGGRVNLHETSRGIGFILEPTTASFIRLNNSVMSQQSPEDARRDITKRKKQPRRRSRSRGDTCSSRRRRTRSSPSSTSADAFASLTFTDSCGPCGPAAAVPPRARGGTAAPARENVDTTLFPSRRGAAK